MGRHAKNPLRLALLSAKPGITEAVVRATQRRPLDMKLITGAADLQDRFEKLLIQASKEPEPETETDPNPTPKPK
jgi:hypothetical protein